MVCVVVEGLGDIIDYGVDLFGVGYVVDVDL